MKIQATGGSSSLKSSYEPLRRAGAVAREHLKRVAAKKWNVDIGQLWTDDGVIFGPKAAMKLTYKQAARSAKSVQPPEGSEISLKSPKDYKWLNQFRIRPDGRAKSTGQYQYGIDAADSSYLKALLIRPDRLNARVKSYKINDVKTKVPGFVGVYPIKRGLAVVCQRYWQAKMAAELIEVKWDESKASTVSTDKLYKQWSKKIRNSDSDRVFADQGDAKEVLKSNPLMIEAEYTVPFLAHAPMEPQNCSIAFDGGSCRVDVPSQAPGLAHQVVAEVTGLELEQIQVNVTGIGGAFGRRLAVDYVREAAELAVLLKKPVQLLWTREDDMAHGIFRPLTVHRLRGAANHKKGVVEAWYHQTAGQSILEQFIPDVVPAISPDWFPGWLAKSLGKGAASLAGYFAGGAIAMEGADKNPYHIEHYRSEFYRQTLDIPVGFWRSVGHSYNGFVVESFIDELAYKAKMNPADFRANHFKKNKRERRVLKKVLKESKFGSEQGANKGQGLALHKSFGTWVAMVAEVNCSSGQIVVERIYCAVDCGRVIDRDVVQAQIEGGIVFGLSQTLHQNLDITNGRVEQSNFHDYPVLRMHECPEILISLSKSTKKPQGIGEPAVPVVAAAVGNAVFAATGQRLRSLPLKLS
jgi:isoquinoline 1-oxidoreductase subunit beta